MMKRYCTVILFVLMSIWGYAKGDSTFMRHFTIENGLPSNNVYAVTQDKFGYMWFNTDNGVVKYDGYTFKTFTTADGLPSNDVWKLYPDKRGRLWVSTHSNKIGYIKDDKYKVIITSKDKAIHPSYINCDANNVYFLYGDLGRMTLAVIDSNDSIKTFSIDSIGNTKSETVLNTIGEDNVLVVAKLDSTIYIRHLSESLLRTDSIKVNFSLWDFVINGGIMSYFGGKFINLWVVRNNILVVNKDGKSFSKVYFPQFGGKLDETIYVFYEENDSMTVITNTAVYRINRDLIHTRRINFSTLFPGNQVAYYTIDKFNNEWFATMNNGIWCRYRLSNIFYADKALKKLLNTKLIGNLSNGDTYWYDKKNNAILKLSRIKNIRQIAAPKNEIPNFVANRSDSEFYVSTNKSIYVYNMRTYQYTAISQYYSIKSIKRYNLTVEPEYVDDSQLIRYAFFQVQGITQLKANKWLEFELKPTVRTVEVKNGEAIVKGLDDQRIVSVCYDSADNLYVFAGVSKLAVYNPQNDKYISVNLEILNSIGISSVQGIAADNFSNIYILDNQKLVVYNIRSRRIQYLKCGFNLSDAHLCTYRNTIFVAGKFGLAYAYISGPLEIGKFHIAVNMNDYSRIYNFVIEPQGISYLSTDKGVYDLNIQDVLFGSNTFNTNEDKFFRLVINYPYQKEIYNSDTLALPQDVTKINLSAINLLGKGAIEYSYCIGENSAWQRSSTGEIFIGALNSGQYYQVRCVMKDNAWESKEFVFYVYRTPYWWQQTSWIIIFWITGVLLFASTILAAILLTKRVVARSNEKKRVLTELELRAIYAQINPHFIFNTLSATLYFINRRKFDDAYVHVNKFSRLIRGYLKSAQERYITLGEELEMLRNYVELQKARFDEKFDYIIEVDNKLPVNNIKIPSLLLQPLVENAINHGLFHRKEGGKLLLKFMQGAGTDELICIIDDNGVGRERAKEIKSASGVKYESYGTKLTKQLIDVFAEFEKMGITLEYIDKQQPETGTVVKLTIKNIKYVA